MPAPAQTSTHNNFFFILCYPSHFQHIFVLQILWLTHLTKSPLRSFYFVIQFQHIFYSTIVMNFQFIFTSIFIAATSAVCKNFSPLTLKTSFLKESCSKIWLFQQTEHPHKEDRMIEAKGRNDVQGHLVYSKSKYKMCVQ